MTVEPPTITAREVTADDGSRLEAFFARTGVNCFCRYWHFGGSSNEWLDRCANAPSVNRDSLRRHLREGRTHGVIATLADGRVVGWLKLTDASDVPKLYQQRLYRGLSCFEGRREGVMTIGCLLVAEPYRRRGVAGRLVECAIRVARACGATAIEAFPRRAEAVSDAELWMGPFEVYAASGFDVVHDFAPYPVLRLDLS